MAASMESVGIDPLAIIRNNGWGMFNALSTVRFLSICLLPPTHRILLFLLFALLSVACRSDYPFVSKQTKVASDAQRSRLVKTVPVLRSSVERVVSVTGALAAYNQATLSMKVPGRLRDIEVDLGSYVRKGQRIAQVDPQDYQLRLQQAEAALAQARARLGLPVNGNDDRVDPEQTGAVRQARAVMEEARVNRGRSESLLSQGLISASQFDSIDANYKVVFSRYQDSLEEIRNREALLAQRRSELALARQQLADTTIYAPFDGAIQQRQSSIGEYLAAGTPVAILVQMDPLRLRAEVPERYASRIKNGQNVRVTVEGDSNTYVGQIVRLSPAISEQDRMLLVEAEVANNGRLRPGSFVRANIITDPRGTAMTVPPSAIVTFAGIEKVLQVREGKILERPVTTGQKSSEWVEIVSGVAPGEKVVLEPGNLQGGQLVTIVEEVGQR
jgi:RND family efflux transporter MFP subunit